MLVSRLNYNPFLSVRKCCFLLGEFNHVKSVSTYTCTHTRARARTHTHTPLKNLHGARMLLVGAMTTLERMLSCIKKGASGGYARFRQCKTEVLVKRPTCREGS